MESDNEDPVRVPDSSGRWLSGRLSAQGRGGGTLAADFKTNLDVPYAEDGKWQGRLDVYARRGTTASPTVIWWHGGNGTKEQARRAVNPLLEMGLSVILPQAPDSSTSPSARSAEQLVRRVVAGRWHEMGCSSREGIPVRYHTTGPCSGPRLAGIRP